MKDKIFYAGEGMVIGFIGHQVWHDVILPVLVAGLCGIVTLLIQFYGKKFLNSLHMKDWPKWKHNGRK